MILDSILNYVLQHFCFTKHCKNYIDFAITHKDCIKIPTQSGVCEKTKWTSWGLNPEPPGKIHQYPDHEATSLVLILSQ